MTATELAAHFRAMADQIERNADATFGGAYVILPPGASEPISVLVVDNHQDAAGFFNLLQWRVGKKVTEMDQEERTRQGFR